MKSEAETRARVERTTEWALIVTAFFVFAGGPVPDVNEAHYLAKAKHYWDATWCPGDFFLESADAHLTFYWTLGWLTRLLPLPAVAWIGRFVVWSLQAWAWQRLTRSLFSGRLVALFTATLYLALQRFGQMSGEWVVGGVEAKGGAYVLVWLGLAALARGRWNAALMLCGAAAGFHVLVGGWAVVAIFLARLLPGNREADRPRWRDLWPGCLGGLLLSLPGLVPGLALTVGVERAVVSEANRIYVFERLPHHLVFHRFPHTAMARQAAVCLLWLGLAWYARRRHERDERLARLDRFVGGAALIAVAGIVIDQSLLLYDDPAARLLRYYWYRTSDAFVPLGATLACVHWLRRREAAGETKATVAFLAALVVAAVNFGEVYCDRLNDPRPAAERQADSHAERMLMTPRWRHEEWQRVCRWIAENTPPDARFLTPRQQQTFKWRAGRSEVVTWKDVPQDARSLVAWKQRFRDVYPSGFDWQGPAVYGFDGLLQLARSYDFDYVVVEQQNETAVGPGQSLMPPHSARHLSTAIRQVYPLPNQSSGYRVYRVSPTE